jgi:hypothetical protein
MRKSIHKAMLKKHNRYRKKRRRIHTKKKMGTVNGIQTTRTKKNKMDMKKNQRMRKLKKTKKRKVNQT